MNKKIPQDVDVKNMADDRNVMRPCPFCGAIPKMLASGAVIEHDSICYVTYKLKCPNEYIHHDYYVVWNKRALPDNAQGHTPSQLSNGWRVV